NQPLVSIITPTYNQPLLLVEAIDSVAAQTYPHWEHIVVDDGSTDDTRTIVESAMRRIGDRLRYIYQANAGTAAARNTGIRRSNGELIALLDHDDRWLPQKLSRQVIMFEEDPDLGLAYGGIRFIELPEGRATGEYIP